MRRHREILLVGILIVVAFFIQGNNLERQSLWNDEMFTMDIVSKPADENPELPAAHYHHPPLYFHITRFIVSIFGVSAWAIRLPSVIFGALSVGLIYLYTRKLFSKTAGLVAAAICMLSPFYLAYAQEGRPYALAAFLFIASSYTFYLLLYDRNRYAALFYPLSTLALLYTHHWGIFALGAHFVYLMFFERSKVRKNYWLFIPWLVIGIFYLPKLIDLRNQLLSAWQVSWFWAEPPNWGEVYRLLTAFSGSYFKMASSVFSLPVIFQVSGAIILAVLLISGIIIAIRVEKTPALRFTLFIFGGLLAMPFAVSFFKPEIFLWYRYTVIGFPVLCAALGGIFSVLQLTKKRLYVISADTAVSGLAIIGVIGIIHYMSWQKSNVKEAVQFTDQVTMEHRIRIIIRPQSFAPMFDYYYRGTAAQYDEAYLNTKLGDIVDTVSTFAYISLDVPNEIREYMDGHFYKFVERRFPGEANMGLMIGLYSQYPDFDR